jgi:hypothetical protein
VKGIRGIQEKLNHLMSVPTKSSGTTYPGEPECGACGRRHPGEFCGPTPEDQAFLERELAQLEEDEGADPEWLKRNL